MPGVEAIAEWVKGWIVPFFGAAGVLRMKAQVASTNMKMQWIEFDLRKLK
jgi:hypothetical protein